MDKIEMVKLMIESEIDKIRNQVLQDIKQGAEYFIKNGCALAEFGGDNAIEGRLRIHAALIVQDVIQCYAIEKRMMKLNEVLEKFQALSKEAQEMIKNLEGK